MTGKADITGAGLSYAALRICATTAWDMAEQARSFAVGLEARVALLDFLGIADKFDLDGTFDYETGIQYDKGGSFETTSITYVGDEGFGDEANDEASDTNRNWHELARLFTEAGGTGDNQRGSVTVAQLRAYAKGVTP